MKKKYSNYWGHNWIHNCVLVWHVCIIHITWWMTSKTVHLHVSKVIGTNLLWGAVFSRGLSGLVAMSASSASQLVFGEQLNSWWDTPAATWNATGDLWSSSTSCRSGMSSKAGVIKRWLRSGRFFTKKRKEKEHFVVFTVIHVTSRWGGQVLVALEGVKGLVHSRSVLLFLVLKTDSTSLINFVHHVLVNGCKQKQSWNWNDLSLLSFCQKKT